MAPNSSGWWTDEKVDATVTSQYVHSHLRPNEAEQLTKSVFGDLSDDTYLEWILTRSKRFFLTLVEADVPDQIFGIIDDSWDDEDLPIPEDEVAGLLLSAEPDKTVDRRFYRAQFKYLIRVVGDGEHIRYAQEETIPVSPIASKSVIGKSKDGIEKVKLPSDTKRVFLRKRVALRSRFMEEELLAEMADWRNFAHEHVLSIFGSYTTEDSLYVLMTPAPEYSLKSFLNDTPKVFEALSKSDRRKITLQWVHCLASGLAWLHSNNKHHGAIRPSRIQMDDQLRICLGQFDGTGILCDSTVKDDIEAYQYAAPERWKRSVTIQATGSARTALPSGGRTARRTTMEVERAVTGDKRDEPPPSSSGSHRLDTARPTSVSYVFSPTSKTGTRLRLGSTKNAIARAGSSLRRAESRQATHLTDGMRPTRTSLETHARPGAISAMSTSSGSDKVRQRRQTGPIYAATPEMRTAVVQTWASAQHDQLAADIFSLGAIIMDILTFICKHSYSSFARHRASKNKSAGRGGGLADASFHANIGQVFTWAEQLQKDAEKRIKKEDGPIFKAVGPCLQVVLQCLDREPSERLSAAELQKKLGEHIRDFAGFDIARCCLDGEVDRSQERPQSRGVLVDTTRQNSAPRHGGQRKEGKTTTIPEFRQIESTIPPSFTPRIDSLRISPANFNNFNFDIDHATTTLIGSEAHPSKNPQPRPDSFAFATGDSIEVFPRPPTASSRRHQPRSEASEQPTGPSPLSATNRVAFHNTSAYAPSAAPSTIAASEDFQSVYSYTPPPTAYPTRELPPVPRISNKPSPTSNPHQQQSQHPSRSTSRNIQLQISDPEPTALPTIPNTNTPHSETNNHIRATRKIPGRMDAVDEISAVESNPRQYRSPSRAGMAEKLYVGHPSRDKLGIRGLQYP